MQVLGGKPQDLNSIMWTGEPPMNYSPIQIAWDQAIWRTLLPPIYLPVCWSHQQRPCSRCIHCQFWLAIHHQIRLSGVQDLFSSYAQVWHSLPSEIHTAPSLLSSSWCRQTCFISAALWGLKTQLFLLVLLYCCIKMEKAFCLFVCSCDLGSVSVTVCCLDRKMGHFK